MKATRKDDITTKVIYRAYTANTICPRISDPFYIVSYYIEWATTSWTHSSYKQPTEFEAAMDPLIMKMFYI